MSAAGLSLWLSPTGLEFEKLKKLIERLAAETEGCLPFDPHLTLISDDQVPQKPVDKVLGLVSGSVKQWNSKGRGESKFELKFKAIESGERFYQCVLVSVELSPALLSLNTILREALVPDPAARASMPAYFPHFSIVYGDLNPIQKQALVARASEALQDIHGFVPAEILLVSTSGPSSNWKLLGKINLADGAVQQLG